MYLKGSKDYVRLVKTDWWQKEIREESRVRRSRVSMGDGVVIGVSQ